MYSDRGGLIRGGSVITFYERGLIRNNLMMGFGERGDQIRRGSVFFL